MRLILAACLLLALPAGTAGIVFVVPDALPWLNGPAPPECGPGEWDAGAGWCQVVYPAPGECGVHPSVPGIVCCCVCDPARQESRCWTPSQPVFADGFDETGDTSAWKLR